MGVIVVVYSQPGHIDKLFQAGGSMPRLTVVYGRNEGRSHIGEAHLLTVVLYSFVAGAGWGDPSLSRSSMLPTLTIRADSVAFKPPERRVCGVCGVG